MQTARQPRLGAGEAMLSHPAFQGKIAPKPVVDAIKMMFEDQGNRWLKVIQETSGFLRLQQAALDVSAPVIQGSPLMFSKSKQWGYATAKMYEMIAHPSYMPKYLAENAWVIQETGGRMGTAPFEFFEALPQLKKLTAKMSSEQAAKFIDKAVEQVYGRAQVGFGGWGAVARIEGYKAMKDMWLKEGGTIPQLAEYLMRATGVTDISRLGMPVTEQQFLRGITFFAANYTAAAASYISYIFKGGVVGKEARKSLALLAAGMTVFMYGAAKALGQKPNIIPGEKDYLTVNIKGVKIGPPGIYVAVLRLLGDVTASVGSIGENEPLDFVKLSKWDNPFIRFMAGRVSPVTNIALTVKPVLSGDPPRDYMGMPFETPRDYAEYIIGLVSPFWAEPFYTKGRTAEQKAIEAATGFAGLRSYPESTWDKRETLRVKAVDKVKADWGELSQSQRILFGPDNGASPPDTWQEIPSLGKQRILETDANLKAVTEQYSQEMVKKGDPNAVLRSKYDADRERIFTDYQTELNKIQSGYQAKAYKGRELKEAIQSAREKMGYAYDLLERDPEYQAMFGQWEKWRQESPEIVQDAAYDEYRARVSNAPDLEDEYGRFLFDEAQRRTEELKTKWGPDIWAYIEQRIAEGRKEDPPIVQEYYKSREVLRPYWEVPEFILSKYPAFTRIVQKVEEAETTNPLLAKRLRKTLGYKRYDALVTKMRRYLRVKNPDVDRFGVLFFDWKPWQTTDWGRDYLRGGGLD